MFNLIPKALNLVFSLLWSGPVNKYKAMVEQLRRSLNELERGTIPDVDFENDIKLIDRAKGLLLQFKGKQHRLDAAMLSRLEKLVVEIEKMRRGWRIKAARKIELL